jgi:hypothetical protein
MNFHGGTNQVFTSRGEPTFRPSTKGGPSPIGNILSARAHSTNYGKDKIAYTSLSNRGDSQNKKKYELSYRLK